MSSSSITTRVNGGGRFLLSSWPFAAAEALFVLSRAIQAGLARTQQRRALRELADHDDQHLLRDIGMTRQAAYREAAKRFWQR
jgi:uncharacterized protein YjiS (DUF1127 family)